MKKKIFITVLLVALFIVLIPQDAHAIPMGDYVYTINPDGTTCTIIEYTGGGGDITIPDQLGGYDVTIIEADVFHLKGITSVTLPNMLDKIQENAFKDNNIISLTIPDSVTYIDVHAFEYNNISSLTLGNSLILIGQYAFSHNSLSSVTLPDSLRHVKNYAFSDNPVGSITLPAPPDGYVREWNVMSGGGPATEITDHSDEYVREFAATPIVYNITYNLDSGTNHASNPDTYTVEDLPLTLQNPTRDGRDFIEWSPESTITVGSTGNKTFTAVWSPYFYVSYIAGTCTIKDYFGAGGDINIPDTLGGLTVTAIGNSAFENLDNVNVTIPSSVISVNNFGFNGCSFTGITLNEGLISVGEGAFHGLHTSDIGTLTLPNSLTTIKRSAFSQAGISDIVFGSGLTSIGENAFSFNKLTSLNFPSGIASISNYCFSDNNISTLNLPSTIETIGDSAFSNNDIANITIPDSVTTIGENAFEYNPIATLTLGNSVQDIKNNAFWASGACTLSSVILPDSLTHIGISALYVFSLITESVALPQPPNGYRRDWKDSSNNVYTTIEGATFSKELTREPSNTPIDYTITYHLDGGTNHASNPSTYTIEDADITLQAPTRDGYVFGGWSPSDITIETGSTGNIEFTASWIAPHNVTINLNSNATISPFGVQQVDHGETLTITVTPKEGYEFYYVDVTGNYSYSYKHNPDGSTTMTLTNVRDDNEVTFSITKKSYTVNITCGANGSITPNTESVSHGSDLTITPTPDAGYSPVVTATTHTIIDNGDGTFTLKNITSDDTINVTFEPMPVTSLTLTDDALEMNVGVTSNLATTFPYTILPTDAANKAVRYSSTNPEVAEVNNTTGMITTKKQGITQIYAISEQNSAMYDSLTLTVKDPAPAPIPPQTHTANIKGRLIDDSGNPLAGYPVTLCSDPITMVTDANGMFQFIGVPFTNHTLIINHPDITEAGRFNLNITEGSSTSSSTTGDNIDITFTGDTEDIDITLQQSMSPTGFDAGVVFTQKPKPVYDPSVKVENPNTGDWD